MMPQKILDILFHGPATTSALAAGTGMTRQTVNRKLRALGDSVVVYDKVRPPLYYAVVDAFESGNKILVAGVDQNGNANLLGVLRPLAHGGFFLQTMPESPKVLLGEQGDGFYDDLPYFIDDMRPQGFIGRQIARNLNAQSDMFPPDPRDWNREHIGRYLVANGDDLPGNLKIGRMALDRVRRPPQKYSREEYPELADKAVEGEVPGSSAGGEHAKFAIFSRERNAHVIVKFSPKGRGELAERWRDILAAEYTASVVLREYDMPVAELMILEAGGRIFLEALRFDRAGEHGRLPLISMQAIDNEFVGVGSGWLQVAKALHGKGLISKQHLHDIAIYWGFGRLINNTDMHLGNLSFSMDGSGFRLAPVYDMCSMGFAPLGSGAIPGFSFSPPDIDGQLSFIDGVGDKVREMARSFWGKMGESELISPEFRRFLGKGNPLG